MAIGTGNLNYHIMSVFNNYSFSIRCLVRALLVPALLFLCAEVQGQEAKAKAKTKARGVLFTCVSWDQLSLEELYYREGREYHPLEVIPYKRSKSYRVKGMPALELYIKATDAKGRLSYELVGQSPLLPNTRRMLFFMVESPDTSELPLRVVGMDDSVKAFPRGAFRFFNMSNAALTIGFGDQIEPIPAKSTRMLEPEIKDNGSFIPFVVADEDGAKVYETRLIGQSTGRKMVFIMPPTESNKRVTVKFISQVVPQKAASDDEDED